MGNFSAAPGALSTRCVHDPRSRGSRAEAVLQLLLVKKGVKSVKDEGQSARFSVQVGLIFAKDKPD